MPKLAFANISPTPTAAWTDQDLDDDFTLPADVQMVFLVAYNNSAGTVSAGARCNGSTDNRTDTIRHHGLQGFFIKVDADNIIELYIGSSAIEFYAVGYDIDGNCVFNTNAVQQVIGSGAYTDNTPDASAIAACYEWQGGTNYGQRNNGSTDNRTNISQSHMWSMAGCDGSGITEIYRQSGGINPYLHGYWTDGLTVNTNGIDQSLGSTGSWINITANVSGVMALVEIVAAAGNDYGLRDDGASWTITGHPGGDSHAFHMVGMTSDIYDGNITNTGVDFYELLTMDAPAVGGRIMSSMAYHGGLVGHGGIAGPGGGLAG